MDTMQLMALIQLKCLLARLSRKLKPTCIFSWKLHFKKDILHRKEDMRDEKQDLRCSFKNWWSLLKVNLTLYMKQNSRPA